MDILQEILSEPTTSDAEKARTRQSAEAAQKLYQEAANLCERYGYPFSCIRVEVWSRGRDKRARCPRLAACLVYGGKAFDYQQGFAPPGPHSSPFGSSWLMIEGGKPKEVKSHKQPLQDVYKIQVATWVRPYFAGPQTALQREKAHRTQYRVVWERARQRSNLYWYTGLPGEYCDKCKKDQSGHEVHIEPHEQALHCRTCARAMWAERIDQPGEPQLRIIPEVVDLTAWEEKSVVVPSFSRAVQVVPLANGDCVTQYDGNRAVIQKTFTEEVSGGLVSLSPQTLRIGYHSPSSGPLRLAFHVYAPALPNLWGAGTGPSVPAGARTRRSVTPPQRIPASTSGLAALVRGFDSLNPLGKAVAVVGGAIFLNGILGQTAPKIPSADAWNDPIGLNPKKEGSK